MFDIETVIETLGDTIGIEGATHSTSHIRDGKLLFLLKAEGEKLQLLDQRLTRLSGGVDVISTLAGLARLALHPLPDLYSLVCIGIDDKVLVD